VQILPASNALNQPTTLTFVWNVDARATSYRFQLSQDSLFATTFIDSTLSDTTLHAVGLQNGTRYFWRVNASNVGGTSTYSASRPFTTIIGAPAIPVQILPASNALNQPTALTFVWSVDARATSYRLQLSTDSLFASTLVDSTLSDTALHTTGLQNGTRYFWRVNASNVGGTSTYSANRPFTTIIAQPPAPLPMAPVDNALDIPIALTIAWHRADRASAYQLQLSSDSLFAGTLVDSSLSDTALRVSGLRFSTRYHWRVRALNPGGVSDYCPVSSFETIIEPPPVPVQTSPGNGLAGVPTSALLTWNSAPRSATYRAQLALDSLFVAPVVDSILTNTALQLTGLQQAVQYYWRVLASNAGGRSAFSAVWSFTTIIAAPQVPTLLSPLNNGVDLPVNPLIMWRGVEGATAYRAQLSTDSLFVSLVLDSTLIDSAVHLTGLQHDTRYYWRASAQNAGGSSGYSLPWQFATVVAPPLPPTPTSPVDSAIDVPTSLTLSWNPSPGATTYHLQLAVDSAFSLLERDLAGLTGTSMSVTMLSNNVLHYWRVSASNVGGTSAYAPTRQFRTIVGGPGVPVALLPANGATSIAVAPVFSWSGAVGATSYNVQVSSFASFASLVKDTLTSDTTLGFGTLQRDSTYYWRVRAINVSGSSAWFSPPFSFRTIISPPQLPALVAPANGTNSVPVDAVLIWRRSALATVYHIRVSSDSAFATTIIDASYADTTVQVTGLQNDVTYFWRVSASDTGGTSAFSPSWAFTTIVARPALPAALVPIDHGESLPTALTFTWTHAPRAALYRFQLSTDSLFGSLDVDSVFADTALHVQALVHGMNYFWRVSASNAGGTSGYTPIRSFTTIILSPPAPVYIAPPDHAREEPLALICSWRPPSGATSYRFQLATDSLFAALLVDSLHADTTIALENLSHLTDYYWRVSASNAGGGSGFAGAWRFTTVVAPPSTPALSAPVNGATGIPTTIAFSWETTARAASYRFQLSMDSLFAGPVLDSLLTDTVLTYNGLLNDHQYYWRVRASNAGGTGGFSPVWNFRTIVAAPLLPVLFTPADSAANIATNMTFVWHRTDRATWYQIQISSDSLFSTKAVDSATVDTTFHCTGLNHLTTYYWRVRAGNAAGSGPFSPSRKFTTQVSPPLPPLLLVPADGTRGTSTTTVLRWTASNLATSYRIQLTQDSTFASNAIDSLVADTAFHTNTLLQGTKYFWRVSALNAGGTSQFAGPGSFVTGFEAPAPPVLLSPAGMDTGISLQPTLLWHGSSRAAFYHLQVALDSGFTNIVLDSNNIVDTSYTSTGLSRGTTLYWRVSASNPGGSSAFSAFSSFTTTITSVKDLPGLPQAYGLSQNYPNPFNPSTTIQYALPEQARVTLTVFNALGQLVTTLADGMLPAGYHEVSLNAHSLTSGVYFLRLEAIGQSSHVFTQVRKMILAK
jgi:hypothetical protein